MHLFLLVIMLLNFTFWPCQFFVTALSVVTGKVSGQRLESHVKMTCVFQFVSLPLITYEQILSLTRHFLLS